MHVDLSCKTTKLNIDFYVYFYDFTFCLFYCLNIGRLSVIDLLEIVGDLSILLVGTMKGTCLKKCPYLLQAVWLT